MNRSWFQFHLSTAVVLMFVAGGLLWANTRCYELPHQEGGCHCRSPDCYGFPFTAVEDDGVDPQDSIAFDFGELPRSLSVTGPSGYKYVFVASALLDIAVALALILVTGFLCEYLTRRKKPQPRRPARSVEPELAPAPPSNYRDGMNASRPPLAGRGSCPEQHRVTFHQSALLFVASLLAACALPGEAPLPGLEDVPPIVAEVNGVPIRRNDLVRELVGSAGPEALDRLVRRTLIEQAARKLNVTVTDEDIERQLVIDRRDLNEELIKGFADVNKEFPLAE
ncbi:MAG: hypothetical protein NTW87_25855, partial [Planctomycetota bacterium]|nr:hypothetical protein [Planctomycetota bacterium]